MKSILFISHSSKKTGGGEDDFQKLLIHFHGKYKIYTIFPPGERSEIFIKYSDEFFEVEGSVFPFTRFNIKEYIYFFLKNYKKAIKIYNFIKYINVDLCYLNSSVCFLEAIILFLLKVPYILSVKEKINPLFVRKILYTFYDISALKIITISKFLQNEIIKDTNRKDIRIIYSTINEKLYDELQSSDFKNRPNGKELNILNIGSIYPLKGQHILMESMKKLQNYNVKTKFVGEIIDEKYFKYLERIKNDFINDESVIFINGLPKNELIKLMHESDVIVITSKEEGQSLIILEALYLEKPIITTKVGVALEVIKDFENGLFYNYGDVNKLCELVLLLKNDRKIYNFLVSNCKITYSKNFNSENMMIQYENLFYECFKSINAISN